MVQYFLWYLCLLPVALPSIGMAPSHAVFLASMWFAAQVSCIVCQHQLSHIFNLSKLSGHERRMTLTGQGCWLLLAYLLEFWGWGVFVPLWIASIAFFSINCYVAFQLAKSHHGARAIKSPTALH